MAAPEVLQNKLFSGAPLAARCLVSCRDWSMILRRLPTVYYKRSLLGSSSSCSNGLKRAALCVNGVYRCGYLMLVRWLELFSMNQSTRCVDISAVGEAVGASADIAGRCVLKSSWCLPWSDVILNDQFGLLLREKEVSIILTEFVSCLTGSDPR